MLGEVLAVDGLSNGEPIEWGYTDAALEAIWIDKRQALGRRYLVGYRTHGTKESLARRSAPGERAYGSGTVSRAQSWFPSNPIRSEPRLSLGWKYTYYPQRLSGYTQVAGISTREGACSLVCSHKPEALALIHEVRRVQLGPPPFYHRGNGR